MPPGLRYPDRRDQHTNSAQWDVAPGTGRAENTGKREPSEKLATRVPGSWEQDEKGKWVYKPGSRDPHKDFRVTTGMIQAPEQPPQLPPDQKYADTESSKIPPYDLETASLDLGLVQSESSATQSRASESDAEPGIQESAPQAYNPEQSGEADELT